MGAFIFGAIGGGILGGVIGGDALWAIGTAAIGGLLTWGACNDQEKRDKHDREVENDLKDIKKKLK